MSKNLVLVESPAKAKTINKYLGKNYFVEATIGHIKNLPKTRLGVKIEDDFQPEYVTIRGKGDTIKKIKGLAAKSKAVYIATDPDREGEAIAQDVADILNGKSETKLYRVLFNEITKSGVEKAMKHPREIDFHLVQSQRARRVMDRIIGYKMSPFLWKAIIENSGSTSLSAGRVQSVALKLICDREAEIDKFKTIEYWSIWAIFKTESNEFFKAKLFSIAGKDIKVPHKLDMSIEERNEFNERNIAISTEGKAQKYFDAISGIKQFLISNIIKRHTRRIAPAPFITSTLQAEASRRLRMRPKQTMMLAQKLYEGVELGKEGLAGLITYMRTDSTRISEEVLPKVRDYIKDKFGDDYLPDSPILYDKKTTSNVQDAHEAIRPTSLEYTPEFVKQYLDDKSFKLYELIWKRFIASQMNPALFETTVIEISAKEFVFKALGSAILFNGFQQVYEDIPEPKENAEDKEEYRNEKIPLGLEKDQTLGLKELQKTQHFTKPPARYTESSLIKALENRGIGRPSTYSMIVSTIQDRKYVHLTERKLAPTMLGKKVSEILVKNFPDIINEDFTAAMENELDQIAQGENEYKVVLADFYNPFAKALKLVENKIEKIICEKCGGELVIKIGRFGKYLACNNYPKCENIKSFREVYAQQKEVEYTGETCAKCGSKTIFREGKFGRFIGCEKYPECDYVKNITLGISCPKCKEGEILERKSKRNKVFYGCSHYPNCDFVSWHKPFLQACPNGDSEIMEERYSKKKGNYLKCPTCAEELIAEEVKEEDEN
ncbi:MAG: DNA topoisomerase I [Ignavibacteria bacterium RIFOXYB2_FULL_35_12]|nr:MAG: DNA topoisomerase I [Ignavibacteria bacterium GWA2_36_19]OGU50250.1 MAG: DNA topoisomerase I [Ignavibacteria bacterium GWC2_35_8]OGU57967.1 MAG: DNA topoisomerase I [Ignavibacteria bacterium GWF2_35_20]OGU79513.1 MAG: DNA topoisomerase I [Ignavibacteria bacterium RIFOXYA2_FULL_35_9]OGU90496.1 MAG: DNA topoisomerase I [Ignavibacteria bacterium RIFOXYC12_FULL_35_11]OGU91917.1 MAG: DNA topoisomerase I [Ignavibacteria bacterium RIFOXYA12_FULL_35_25]OGU95102.1 MAG: DNA topoisomerase I [Ign